MKIKVLFPNERGKIEFTKEELETLLEECYQDGIAEGKKLGSISYPNVYYSTVTDYPQNYFTTCSTSANNAADGVYPSCLTDVAYADYTLTGAKTNDQG